MLPDDQQQLGFANYTNAVARMRSDLTALRQHGALLGIDSDHIRFAHAYHSHLEHFYAETNDSASSYASCHKQTLNAHTHLQAREATGPIPYPALPPLATPVVSCGRPSPVMSAPGSGSSSSSFSTHLDGGVGTLVDPGRVVHNLPNGIFCSVILQGLFSSPLVLCTLLIALTLHPMLIATALQHPCTGRISHELRQAWPCHVCS